MSGQPGGKPLCHPYATSEENKTSPSASALCCHPAALTGQSMGSCSTPAAPVAPWSKRGQHATGTEGTATLTARLSIEWLQSHSLLGKTGVPMTTRCLLRCVSLTQMTNLLALEEWALFESQRCADKPNKCKTDIAVSIIVFFFFFIDRWK